MRIVAAIAAFAAGRFHYQKALRRELAINFGATLGHPRPRHNMTPFPENFEPSAFCADGFLFLRDGPRSLERGRLQGQRTGSTLWTAPWSLR
jgi:hypothetical protein